MPGLLAFLWSEHLWKLFGQVDDESKVRNCWAIYSAAQILWIPLKIFEMIKLLVKPFLTFQRTPQGLADELKFDAILKLMYHVKNIV